jgi:DNA-binding transcriptional LysR family regulator
VAAAVFRNRARSSEERQGGQNRAMNRSTPRHIDPVMLRLFVAVCEELSIARTAAGEALVASAVSKRIAAVEQAIGAPPVVRGRRGIEPTAAGEVLLRQARDVLGQLERMRAELSEFATGVQGSVRVMTSVSALAASSCPTTSPALPHATRRCA